ncbi:uncharacterized protein LOC118405598 [Branchiostoma floridae]|uniref:Uncharacterized protein LOC118405598 n=2 Tax=Branchiostoma floridae TaxID=7739 RepID=A0A9J7KFW5_BRAFL|nr:uncharacterized protein LOC118405598 [Branchiostoma floridae]
MEVSVNKLETLPDGISRLQLHELYVPNNRFKEIPDEICSLLQLKTFSVGRNPLKSLPDKISQLTGLRTMFMNSCQFDEFPRQVLQLEGLKELYMRNWAGEGKPSPVPKDIGTLKNLQVLDLRSSGLESLPDGVGELEQLRYLDISRNRFTSVPEQIMNLPNIEKLDLSDNNISSLPLSLCRLAKLKDMAISGNPLTYPPADVCDKGTAAIMDFLRRELKNMEERELRKVFHRFSQSVTESSEVEDLGGALGLTADEMINIQASRNTKPSSQAYKVLSKWKETDREASMDKLEKELSESGMSHLVEKASRIQSQPAKRPADTSGGPPTKRRAAGGPSSVNSEDKLAQLQGENRTLKAQVQKLQGSQKPRSREPGDKPVVMLLNDEYGIRKGGISTINREIGCLLVSKGAEVLCTVLNATQQDKDDAAADGIRLIFPATFERDPRKPELHWLTFDHQTRYPDLPSHVDFIVGHVHITSHAARRIKDRFPVAKLVQVTHVMPEDTSHYKGVERVLSIGKESDNILDDLRHADVIFSVGPLMYDYYKHQTKQLKLPHHKLLPKPSNIFINLHPVPPLGTETKVVLSIGRVKGVERLKGYDLAAKSMWDVMKELTNTKWRLRGVTKEDFRGSQEIINANKDKVEFVPFTPLEYGTQEELRDDMGRADVVLMPSRAEPFGLVGLEAIAAGVPVVISHKSGLAKFLKTQDPEFDRTIVEIGDDDDKAAQTLSKRIIDILKDGPREFQAAQSLKKKLLDSKYWTESHTNVLQTFGLEG